MGGRNILLYFTLIFYCSTFLLVCVHCGERDDELIAQLLETSEKSIDELDDSQVTRIFKALEAAENTILSTPQEEEGNSAEEPLSHEQSDSIPEIKYWTTTTPKPDPFFFNTQSPFYARASPANANTNTTSEVDDEVLLMELEKAILGAGEEASETSTAQKRSSYGYGHGWHHDPPLDGLLWSTAKAVWDIARPAFYYTKAGLKLAAIKETVTLPLRTFGHIKSHVLDLTNPGKRSVHGWGGWGHDHHHHGWGWDDKHHRPVYVKYEPNNSLFKSWLRFIIRVLRPTIAKTYHLKRTLFWLKLRLLGSLIKILKYSKLKGITELIKSKLKPNIVVVQPTEEPVVVHHGWEAHGWEDPHLLAGWPASSGWADPHPPHKGWSGWTESPPPPTKGWHGWPGSGWSESSPHKGWVEAPIKAKYGHPPPPAPKPSYGPPSQLPSGYDFYSTPMQSYGAPPPDSSYGPPAASSDGHAHTYLSPPRVKHSPTPNNNGPAPPSTMPESSLDQVADPSYNKYLKQLGINTDDLSPESVRNLRESEKEAGDVPYLIPSESASSKEDASNKEITQ